MRTVQKKTRMKVFFENIFIYGIFGSVEKIVPIIMLPIITRIIADTSEYGVYSMFTTIQSFGVQIAILGLYDAVFREYFEKDDETFHKRVLSTALDIVVFISFIIGILMVVFSSFFSRLFIGDAGYDIVIYLSAFGIICGSTRSIFSLPVRIRNQRSIYIVTNLLQAILGYAFAIVMILILNINYIALIYSSVLTSLILTIFYAVYNKRDFSIKLFDRLESKELLKIGIPLVPTFVIYWVFNSFDKIMITNMLSLNDVGIFTIGMKLASISQIVYTAFATGWQYFAFSTMKDDDQVKLTSTIMECLAAFSVFIFFLATIFDEYVFKFVFTGDYELGYIVFPYLFLAPLLLMFYQTGANQFLVYKKSYYSTLCLAVGAVANIILNYVLIMYGGIKGAALATLLGYLISIIMMVIINSKKNWIVLSKRMFLILTMIIALSLHIYLFDNTISIVIAIAFSVLIVVAYFKEIKVLSLKIRNVLLNVRTSKRVE